MRIKLDNKNIKKLNAKRWNWKINKFNLIQFKDWGSVCNFARLAHLLRWRREKRGRRRKIIIETSSCNEGGHASTHCVEGGVMLRTPPWKAMRGDWEALHMPPKRQCRLPPAGACTNFFIYQKTRTPLTHVIIAKNQGQKTKNALWPQAKKKKSWPQELLDN
jgi:hypothetical protein